MGGPPSDDIDRPGQERDNGAPRWVKAFAAVVIALVVLVAAVLILGGGDHGPGRHSLGSDLSHAVASPDATSPPFPLSQR